MTERDWSIELERWLQTAFLESWKAIGQGGSPAPLRISPTPVVEESKYFLLGLEAGLFRSDEAGYIQSELLRRSGEEDAEPETYQIFRHDPPPPRLIREGICQLSTAASLILKRGWLRSQVSIESNTKETGSLAYGVDILVRSIKGEILVGVDVKRTAAELEKLMTDLRACCKRGPHAKDDCGFPQNHPNYEFCASRKPLYFWGVAPEGDVCFKVRCGPDSIELEQLTSLPPRSLIEST